METKMVRKIHAAAGGGAMLAISGFILITLVAETSGDVTNVISAKETIARGIPVLVAMLVVTGASGHYLGRGWKNSLVQRKRQRMKQVALNGLFILVPCALYLAWKARTGTIDGWFMAVQGLELAAGTLNVALLGRNMGDGIVMWKRRRRSAASKLR